MSRAGGRGYDYDYQDDRERAYYENSRRRPARDVEQVDIEISRDRGPQRRRPPPEFLRDDYRAPPAGPLVVVDSPSRGSDRDRSRRRPDEVDEEEIILTRRTKDEEERGPRPERVRGPPRTERDDIEIEIRERDVPRSRPRPRDVEREEIDIDIRRQERVNPRVREAEREDIVFRRGSGDRGPPRGVNREEIVLREQETEYSRPRRRERSADELDINIRREGSRGPRMRPRGTDREDIDIRIDRERSTPPPSRRPVARETEEFVYRRRPSPPSPPPPPRQETEEIIIRRRERSPSPVIAPSPPPLDPEPEIRRPPIVQEVITHHRHIDHGFIRAPPSPSSSPSPPPPKRDESFEVEIRRRNNRGEIITEDIRINERDGARNNRGTEEFQSTRERSRSTVARRREEINVEIERDSSSANKSSQASRDPNPNTIIQVNVDGDRRVAEINTDRRVGLPVRPRPKEMWTEITKDLVTVEAIENIGYQYEETEDYFYVMENLRYEDVLELVELSEDLRLSRRDRIEQIQWERKDPRLSAPPPERRPPPTYLDEHTYDERVYEREIIYENGRPVRYRER